jgi:Holliday junction DNA helicase RuvA
VIVGLTGILQALNPDGIMLRIGGVSMKLLVPTSNLNGLGKPGTQVHLYTHLQVTDDSLNLYGFAEEAGLKMFELLLTVGGVGPRVALGILSAMEPEVIGKAIVLEDSDTLSKAPGIGKRTAGRIILELRDRLDRETIGTEPSAIALDGEVVAALRGLGYTDSESRAAMRDLPNDKTLNLEDRIRQVLQQLGSHGG